VIADRDGSGTEELQFIVVKNDDGQYSLWTQDRPPPAGWHAQAMAGSKEQCLEYIRTHWVDMTPTSLKRARAG